ncbi:hypothetical protein EDB83DRAFT_1575761 [Lactarius deliciosus]|nr:hypothetical protein EDB83DRAFT_1575761 [Lactarius deliciosus]
MPMQRYAVSELMRSALGPPHWENRVPNIREYGLTESETEALTSFWQAKRAETCGVTPTPFRAALKHLWYFSMRKVIVHHCAHRALLAFRPTEALVNRVLDRFKRYLLTLPAVSDARRQHVDDIRKLGRILWANIERLEVTWRAFLSAQYVVEQDDLD